VLRAGAIGAGIAGIAIAIAGGVGLIAKPDAVVWASAPLGRAVVVIPPQVIAMDGVKDIVVEGDPWMETRTARPVDAYAWHRGESSIYVQGVSSWTEVKTVKPDLFSYDGKDLTGDIWRSNTLSFGATHIRPADVPAGLAVVVVTRSHGPLSKISIELSRDPGYGWAWPAVSAGALLAAVSMVLFALLWLDLRPARAGLKAGDEPERETADVVVATGDAPVPSPAPSLAPSPAPSPAPSLAPSPTASPAPSPAPSPTASPAPVPSPTLAPAAAPAPDKPLTRRARRAAADAEGAK